MSIPVMKKAQKIKTIIPMTNGIFSHMNYDFRAEVTKVGMDIMFGTNYGQRNPSPIVEGIQSEYNEPMTDNELNSLAALVLQMYKPKWDKLGEIYDIEYDPIHNYLDEWEDTADGTESETTELDGTREDSYGQSVTDTNLRTDNLTQRELTQRDIDSTRTDNLSDQTTYGKTNTRTDNLQSDTDSTTTNTGSGSENNSIYGFNSSTAVNSDSSSNSDTNTETVDSTTTNTGTSANVLSGSDTVVHTGTERNVTDDDTDKTITNTGTQTDARTIAHSGKDTRTTDNTEERNLTSQKDRSGRHFGNIGNLTSQKQILEEINLWRWNYMQEILNDVKEFCTLPVYLCASEWQWVDPQE